MARVRESLGLCPQHNLLFKDLTVKEHLMFFSRLKGLTKQEANSEAKDLLNKLNMNDKRHNKPHELSGGMKRKVSLGIALVGVSKVIY
ncbi:unnamed protein product [Timema podura]|uniref:ABC transporter domain-containing protein n=1 Tax=Timema podura TaxID=61482 RepID=A0ABN7PNX4_TIMPD|nr:unnamed protein product [Timema podura]